MKETISEKHVFEEPSIWKLLFRLAPPVMLAQLIQAMYNIVDSFFVGRYSAEGLAALSIIYPVQLIVTAIAVGTGVGVNTQMSQDYAFKRDKKAGRTAGAGMVLALISWALFAVISCALMRPYVAISVKSALSAEYAVVYGRIVCAGSIGVFLEGVWSKVHQARGNMRLPMLAQVVGALTNIVLDPILIFGVGPIPAMGIAGAAYATVAGQLVAAIITSSGCHKPPRLSMFPMYVKKIYHLGFPSIFMQSLFTLYIMILNVILAGFSDAAVTVLGLYYKLQSFFFIPLYGLQTCIVPLLSYTHAKSDFVRCRKILDNTMILSGAFMLVGVVCFEFLPRQMLGIFTQEAEVFRIGISAFRIVGASFLPAVVSLTMPIFFQAIGKAKPSIVLSLTRQIFCLIPIFWGLSRIGLFYSWMAFPISETITGAVGLYLLVRQLELWKLRAKTDKTKMRRKDTMKMITAIISKKDSDAVCRGLAEGGFYFTKMVSSGGFLSAGNTTVLIGTEEDKVASAVEIIRSHCSKRTESVPATVQLASGGMSNLSQVVVGGATVFVTPVEQFEKM